MKMLADNILVEPEGWPTQKLGKIVLPDNNTVKAAFARGVVNNIGPGPVLILSGEHSPIEVKVGDHILYRKVNAIPIVVYEREMHLIVERDILAILEPNDFGELKESEDATD